MKKIPALHKTLERKPVWQGAATSLASAASGAAPTAASHFEAGLSHARASRNGEAIEELARAVALEPASMRYHRALALLYEQTAQAAAAAREWRAILELDPAHAEAKDMLERLAASGSLRERTGDRRPKTGHNETDQANGTP